MLRRWDEMGREEKRWEEKRREERIRKGKGKGRKL